MKYYFYLTAILISFWLLLSGHYTPFILCCGIASIALTMFLSIRMDVVDEESQPIYLGADIVLYWLWLTKEVVIANIDVCRRIWSPTLDISPTVVCIQATQKTPFGLMVYANSITVTPGTICIDVQGNNLEIHALAWSAADDLLGGEMDRRISKLGI